MGSIRGLAHWKVVACTGLDMLWICMAVQERNRIDSMRRYEVVWGAIDRIWDSIVDDTIGSMWNGSCVMVDISTRV